MNVSSLFRRLVDGLPGVVVSDLKRLAIASEADLIPLLSTLVAATEQGFILMTYSQNDGFVCNPPVPRRELRWDGEIDEGESLELVDLEDDAEVPELPFRVCRLTGWLGTGPYDDLLALALEDDSSRLVLTTTHDDMLCATLDTARREAALVAKNSNMQLWLTTIDISGELPSIKECEINE
jgi:hypothetical protein